MHHNVASPSARVGVVVGTPAALPVAAGVRRPASKYLPVLAAAARGALARLPSDTLLMVCDDDRRYPGHLVAALSGWASRQEMRTSIVGTWGTVDADQPRGPGVQTSASVAAAE